MAKQDARPKKPAAWQCPDTGCNNTAPEQPLGATPQCMNRHLHRDKQFKLMKRKV